MKKILSILALLLMAATGAWAQTTTDVSSFETLKSALEDGQNVKLTSDIACTEQITIEQNVIIDGNGKTLTGSSSRAFSVGSSGTLSIKNLTVTGFNKTGGGGAFVNSGTLVLEVCTVSGNHTEGGSFGGGAIENQGKLYASNTIFSGNYSGEIGGAINNYWGDLYLSGCTFSNNYTTSSNAEYGGAIGINRGSEIRIINCTFEGNKYGTDQGASDLGIYSYSSDYTIAGCSGITIRSDEALTTYEYGVAELDASDLSNIKFTYQSSNEPLISSYEITLATGSNAHGTVVFSVGGNAATQAEKDDVVTVSVTPNEGYSAKDVTVRAYTSWEAASEILTGGGNNPGLVSDVNVTKQENGTWQFTMPDANVWVVVTYTKNLQDAWIQSIADQTYTGEALTPDVVVKDGETTLVLNTDYTVAYSNNTNAGTATVTITAVEGSNYSGTATNTFTIAKADITMITAPAAVSGLVYSGEAQTLITAGVASFGTVLYSLDGTNFSDALPQGTDAGTYTVTYKVEGDDNHNGIAAQTLDVTIATNKTELNDAITEAEAYYNSISESNPEAAAALKTAIDAAKTAKDQTDATQAEVDAATQTLTDALNAAKADVALKRITLTIPAKSYMARIDADKRQIETAVAGVKLYSVKSVTNTEVELTSELSVIAAEMPYFIYNDNDAEVEVSIVVSSSEADNVAYDSEHFKGTLVDKTFTDEDMQEADHYVLSNGSSFVWVKDAGTLAAGKCWVQLAPSSEAHSHTLNIVFEGETTGINSINNAADTKDAAVYDLLGRRVTQPAKGLFIVNGVKVVIK